MTNVPGRRYVLITLSNSEMVGREETMDSDEFLRMEYDAIENRDCTPVALYRLGNGPMVCIMDSNPRDSREWLKYWDMKVKRIADIDDNDGCTEEGEV